MIHPIHRWETEAPCLCDLEKITSSLWALVPNLRFMKSPLEVGIRVTEDICKVSSIVPGTERSSRNGDGGGGDDAVLSSSL